MHYARPLVLRPLIAACLLGCSMSPGESSAQQQAPADSSATTRQSPLTAEQSLAAFRLEPGLRVELVVAEPLVESPVALAFDAQGRMYVAENRGYPVGPADAGRIARLEDVDGDGRYDQRTEFAVGLSYPNGILPWRDGLIVTCAPDILYLEDSDHDGRADRRRVLYTGFSTKGSTQLRASHPTLGIDNWIYVTGGLSGGNVTSPDKPDRQPVVIQRADFRFRPDGGDFERVDGGAQFGQSFDDFGRRFICYNRVQVQHVVLPSRYPRRNPNLAFSETVQNCPAETAAEPLPGHGAAARLYPISRNVTTADSHAGTFTAACGVLIYRGTALPEAYRGGAFSCDPTANLVHFDRIEPRGATFLAYRAANELEFLASSDDWFRPVNLAHGPDGAVYVCDMYRKTIEHPDYLPAEIRKHTDFESGKGLGRIYRVVRDEGSRPAKTDLTKLHGASIAELCVQLEHADGWRRDAAHRLLLERRDAASVPRLRAMLNSDHAPAVVHAIHLLQSLESFDGDLLRAALGHSSPGVREHAVQIAEARLATSPGLAEKLFALADDVDPRVRFQVALSLGESSDPRVIERLARIARRDAEDRWLRAAVLSSIRGRELAFFEQLSREPVPASEAIAQLYAQTGELVGASLEPKDYRSALTLFAQAMPSHDFLLQASALAGLAESLRLRQGAATESALQAAIAAPNALTDSERKYFSDLFDTALRIAQDPNESVDRRGAALALLADADVQSVGETLAALVDRQQPAAIQSQAIRTLRRLGDAPLMGRLLDRDRFAGYTPSLREEVISSFLSQPKFVPGLLAALEAGDISPATIDSLRRRQLTQHRDPAVRDRAAKIFSTSAIGDRAKVYDEHKSVLQLSPNPGRGGEVFKKTCANCHRLDREGVAVGPDLFGIRSQPKEAILLHLLIPEYEVAPGFAAYVVETTDGRVLTGLLAGETDSRVTLRQALGKEESVLRGDIASLTISPLSLMPQELEKTMTRQDLADLLAYLKGER